MFHKGRRPWKRGPKMRYSVYKAEDRLDGEKDYEEWARMMAEAKGYNLEAFLAYDVAPKNFWQETYNRIYHYWLDNEGKEWKIFK